MPIDYGTNSVTTSGLITAISGNFTQALFVSGIPVSISGHSHISSDIIDFASSVSGLLPTIANSGNNRILTSTGSSVGINAEADLTFDGSTLNVQGPPTNNPLGGWGGHGIITASITDGPTGITLNAYTSDSAFEGGMWGGGVITLSTADSAGSSPTLKITPFGLVFGDSTAQSTAWTGSITSSQITDFNSSVSGLLPITAVSGGQNITVTQSGTVFSVAVTGSLGLTTEEVDDRVSNLLVAGSGIGLNYNDGSNTLTVSVSGLSSNGTIGNGVSGVIFYELNQPLNIVGSGTTNVAYDNGTKTVTIGLTSTIKEYELINNTKSIFTVTGGYTSNNLDVYHNGVRLLAGDDYIATNNSTFILTQPAVSGDVVEWLGCSIVPQHQLILGEVRSDTINNINYLGRAVAGSSEASGVWIIKRYTIDSNGLDIITATASNVSWSNRLSASYV